MNEKKWIISEYNNLQVHRLASQLNVSSLCAKLLMHRGFSDEKKARAFIKKDILGFHSPFLLKDMEKATKIIKVARDNGLRTLVWGDYDVDGVTSTTILLKYLNSIGIESEYYIPRRLDEGYGLNKSVISEFASNGGKLLITVDCGITADEEIEYAKSLGITVIVTDHHECRDFLPCADAVVNPKRRDSSYVFKELAGVGVVFKLICACDIELFSMSHIESLKKNLKLYSDFTAIGTIADVMPIRDENRLIVSSGLDELSNTTNIGLATLIEDAGIYAKSYKKKKISSATIGFVLAPKINAVGRMGTSRTAVDLFMTDSREEAAVLSETLNDTNKLRQNIENEILDSAIKKIEKEFDTNNDKIIILSDNTWHHGVIGIVASRITEKYNLPCILVSFKNEGREMTENLGKGSGRSIKGFNLVNALSKCSDLLIKFGGHELAAGLSVDSAKFEEFKKRMNDYAKEALMRVDVEKSINVDCEVHPSEISVNSVNEISKLEPFGLSNPVPVFFVKNLTITSLTSIGDDKHTKILFKKDSKNFTALFFGRSPSTLNFVVGDCVDVVFNMDVNNFKNEQTIQMIIRDIKLNDEGNAYVEQEYSKYTKFINGLPCPIQKSDVPSRDEFTAIYSVLKSKVTSLDFQETEFDLHYVARLANAKFATNISPFKAFVIFDVFKEANIIHHGSNWNNRPIRCISNDSILAKKTQKAELTLTKTMQNLISKTID